MAHSRERNQREAQPPALRSRKPIIVVLAGLVIVATASFAVIRINKRTGSYDGLWVGLRQCPEWQGRQAFQSPVTMTIKNNKAASVTAFEVDSPGYLTYQGTIDPNGKLLLRGYVISGGLPGGLPRGSRYPFLYEGAISGDSYSGKDIGVPRPCTIEMTRQH